MRQKARDALRSFRKDLSFRAEATLYMSLAVNIVYALLNAALALFERRLWFVVIACYYLLLCLLRTLLLRGLKRQEQWRRCRLCAWMLLLMIFSVTGMNIYLLRGEHEISYPWFFIYGVAAFTFYSAVNAVRNVVKYRRLRHPIYSASKAISLAAAAMAMYSLQSALITAFGDGDRQFQRTMGILTGAAVCAIVAGVAVGMIVQSGKNIEKA